MSQARAIEAPLRTTGRLLLRLLRLGDITPAYIDALSDQEVVRLTEARHVEWTPERVAAYVHEAAADEQSRLIGIFLKESGRHIGNIRLFNVSAVHQRAELAFMIFDKAEWSKGYGTEAVGAVVQYAFEALGLHRIVADYYANNTASARLFAKLGFRIEGVFKDHFELEGAYVDSVRVAALAPAQAEAPAPRVGGLIPSAGPSITELEVQRVADAARRGWYAGMRRDLDEFETRFAEYTGLRYALAASSCTGAIHLALMALGVGPGDEVIVPDITWVASAAPICYVGARPVFVDMDPHTWCASPDAVAQAVTKRTKAVIAVGLLGNMPEMDAINAVARRHRLAVIEDAAESIGAEYQGRKAGTCGTLGVYSFNGTKLLVTGEGGMLVTNDRRLYERAKRLAHHGINKKPGARYYWSHELGYKYQFTNMQAAMGLAQLSRIDELVAKRRQLFAWYQQRLQGVDGVQLNRPTPDSRSTYWITTAMIARRCGLRKESVVKALVARGVGARPFFYPLSSMPPFAPYGRGRDMRRVNPVSYALSPYGVCLPSAAALSEADVDEVCRRLVEVLRTRAGQRASRTPRRARMAVET